MSSSRSLVRVDWVTASLYLSLVIIGWLMVYAVGYDDSLEAGIFSLSTNAGKQGLFILVSLLAVFVCFLIDGKFWETFAVLFYGLTILLLVAVLIFGTTVKGATSWFSLGGISLQPSEFAKVGAALAVASFLSTQKSKLDNFRDTISAIALFMVPAILILLQPDAGSALVFLGFFLVLYRAGLHPMIFVYAISAATLTILGLVFNPVVILIGLLLLSNLIFLFNQSNRLPFSLVVGISGLVSIFLAYIGRPWPGLGLQLLVYLFMGYQVFQARRPTLVSQLSGILLIGGLLAFSANYGFNNLLEPHQQDRINVWLQPSKCDPKGALYNVLQSKMAIGSGGLQGKGFLEGTLTKLNYVPEQATDFIFCTIGEEQGFVGVVGIIGIFLILLLRILNLAERQRTPFSRFFAYGVASILFIHIFINIGMTMGLTPIIGIPLPFISKGGSSIIGFSIMIGIMLKLDSVRTGR
ncbi:MAG: rod shape-determining protein RodA [Saprospiraceae bacterium]|nr:rod shape-determining protein RodA [Saprospiraceae bacterium]